MGNDGKVINKLYFSKYEEVGSHLVPLRITEIIYVGEKDSLVNRVDYSELQTKNIDPYYFEKVILILLWCHLISDILHCVLAKVILLEVSAH